jgi:hypothetical protein
MKTKKTAAVPTLKGLSLVVTVDNENVTEDTLRDHLNGPRWRRVVQEIDNYMRAIVKHGVPQHLKGASPTAAIEVVRFRLLEEVNARGLEL